MDDKGLVERLREESLALQKQAWSRQDGGQECSISANLADEASTLIETQAARIAGLTEALKFYAGAWESEVDAEQTALGWTGSIGDLIPSDELYSDKGDKARALLTGGGRG